MKKSIVTLTLLVTAILGGTPTQAQGFLKKIKGKADQATQSLSNMAAQGQQGIMASPSKKMVEEFEKDGENTVLDAMPIKKDKYGIGGLYYARDYMAMYDYDASKMGNATKKFHVAWDAQTLTVTLTNQYTTNGKNPKSLLVYGGFNDGGNEYKWDEKSKRIQLRVCEATKMMRFPLTNGAERNLVYVQNATANNSGHSVLENKPLLRKIDEGATLLYLYKPGIIILSKAQCGLLGMDLKTGTFKQDESEYQKAFNSSGAVLYRKENKAEAEALTQANIRDFILKQNMAHAQREALNLDGQKEWDKEYNKAVDDAVASSANSGSGSDTRKESKPAESTKSAKAKTIRVEIQNLTGDDQFYKVEGATNIGMRHIGNKMITSLQVTPGSVIVLKNGTVIASISEGTKPNTRYKF